MKASLAGLGGLVGSDDSSGVTAQFYYPHNVAVSTNGDFAVVADINNHTIWRIDLRLDTVEVTTLAEDDIAGEASLNEPYDVTINLAEGTAVVTDPNYWPIWQLDRAILY